MPGSALIAIAILLAPTGAHLAQAGEPQALSPVPAAAAAVRAELPEGATVVTPLPDAELTRRVAQVLGAGTGDVRGFMRCPEGRVVCRLPGDTVFLRIGRSSVRDGAATVEVEAWWALGRDGDGIAYKRICVTLHRSGTGWSVTEQRTVEVG